MVARPSSLVPRPSPASTPRQVTIRRSTLRWRPKHKGARLGLHDSGPRENFPSLPLTLSLGVGVFTTLISRMAL